MNINTLKIIPLLGGNVSAYKLFLYITQYSLGMVQSGDGFNGEIYLNVAKLAELLGSPRSKMHDARSLLIKNSIIIRTPMSKDIFAINKKFISIQTRDNDTTCHQNAFKCNNILVSPDSVSNKTKKKSDNKK